ncbi:hypothetical protein SNE40_018147 [Patella caerulea]|uniref:DNA-directed DNA polymerase n=1 Tax=Patella caerulea TaxID=87958 RepID=A0AAN8JC03_PATCE
MFLKIKQESSGYPNELNPSCNLCDNLDTCCHIDWHVLEQKRLAYIKAYEQHENITLDANKISKNPGLRYVSKTALNSLWGKFAERSDTRIQSVITHDPTVFYDYLYDGTKVVRNIEILSEEMVLVQYTDRQDLVANAPHVNVPIGAFTAAYGRMKLYEYLDKLNHRVLYFDTDSIIFTETDNDTPIATGNYLGQFTSETSPGCRILEYVATAPKSYALKIENEKTREISYTIKSKGITFNHDVSQRIEFQTFVELVHDHCRKVKVTYPKAFHRSKVFVVSMKEKSKTLSFNYDKRVEIRDSYDTKAYGFVKQNE